MRGKLVTPVTFHVGQSTINEKGLKAYLKHTGQEDFIASWEAAKEKGLSDAEVMCSMYAKLCYKSLTLGKNANITRVRDIPDNLVGCFQAGHGSVFGHCMLNFTTTDCSRVFTHELVRNHIGTEYSQTSGRYVRLDVIDVILDPILDDCKDIIGDAVEAMEDAVYLIECKKGLRVPPTLPPEKSALQRLAASEPMYWKNGHEEMKWVPNDKLDFTFKKKVTSAARRIAPNGQANEIGWSINLRAIRHVIQMRSSRHAEWEIRYVMSQVYDLINEAYPMLFYGMRKRVVDGLPEFYGAKTQPYQLTEDEVLKAVTLDQLTEEVARRGQEKK